MSPTQMEDRLGVKMPFIVHHELDVAAEHNSATKDCPAKCKKPCPKCPEAKAKECPKCPECPKKPECAKCPECPKRPDCPKCPEGSAKEAHTQVDPFASLTEAGRQNLLLLNDIYTLAHDNTIKLVWPTASPLPEKIYALVSEGAATLYAKLAAAAPPQLKKGWQSTHNLVSAKTRPLLAALQSRFPQQQAFSQKREPADAIFLIACVYALFAWQVYGFWKLILYLPRKIFGGAKSAKKGESNGKGTSEPSSSGAGAKKDAPPSGGKKNKKSGK